GPNGRMSCRGHAGRPRRDGRSCSVCAGEVAVTLWKVFYQAVQGYIRHGDLSRGAAIAFYTVTSLAPLLLIVIALAGLVIGTDAARTGVIDEFAGLVGPEGADLIKSIVARSSDPASGTASTVIGAVTVLVTA